MIDGRAFPADAWDERTVVILSWWAQAIERLLEGGSRSERIPFMGGPYEVVLELQSATRWRIAGVVRASRGGVERMHALVDPAELTSSVVHAISRVVALFHESGWPAAEVDALQRYSRALNRWIRAIER